MERSERPQDDQRSWQGSQDRDQDDITRRGMQTAGTQGSMQTGRDDWGQSDTSSRSGQSWTGYVVPYRYYGPGYRGVGYYSVMYLGPSRSEEESRRAFDQRNVDYGQGQGAGAAWTGGSQRGAGMTGGFAGRGPKGYRRSDQRIEEEINDRLMADDRLDASEIEVTVKNGEVTLTGTVDDREAKRRAEDVAESVMGVEDVMNQLRVGSSASGWSGSRSSQGSQGSQRSQTRAGSGTTNRGSTSRNGGRSTDESTSTTSSSR
jgi:osmotically-inducible protein OsmY